MRKLKLYRRSISALLIAVLLTVTTGFRIESHSCDHCGLELSLSFFREVGSISALCCGAGDYHSHGKTNCGINSSACCTLTDNYYELEEPYIIASSISEPEAAPVLLAFYQPGAESRPEAPHAFIDIRPQYGGRNIVILNSQYRT